MKTVSQDKLTIAIWRAVCEKCGEIGVTTLHEWLGEVIHATAKTAENRLVKGDWTVEDVRNVVKATGQWVSIQRAFEERIHSN